MNRFYLTFRQRRYSELWLHNGHPDGWVEIHAETQADAERCADIHFGSYWSRCYTPEEFNATYYPRGCLMTLLANTQEPMPSE